MRHVFIINPFAGKGTDPDKIRSDIRAAADACGINAEIYDKPGLEEMQAYLKSVAESGAPVRVYACGGDGTLYQAVNATWGHPNVEIAAVPYGSGNDFIRLFGTKEELQDVKRHINGSVHEIDAIECDGEIAINQCSMGLDAEVCAKQAAFKKMPLMKGDAAYTASLLYCVIARFNSTNFTIQIDDNEPVNGKFLFALGGNSKWYGGGYMGCPKAELDDGLLDCVMVRRDFGRLKAISLIGVYKKGEHLSWPFTSFVRGKKMKIHSDIPAAVNVDGECHYVNDTEFILHEKSVKFVVPQDSPWLLSRKPEAAE
jgi:diacylglycerol kinase family enzyme